MFKNEFMNFAIKLAQQALDADEVPVGAVIINPITKEIISQSYNLVEQKKDPTAHAEILAIQAACKKLNSKNLTEYDIYTTMQPCAMCMQAISYARLRRVYFGAYDTADGNYRPEIYDGIKQQECKALLDNFFKNKRRD